MLEVLLWRIAMLGFSWAEITVVAGQIFEGAVVDKIGGDVPVRQQVVNTTTSGDVFE